MGTILPQYSTSSMKFSRYERVWSGNRLVLAIAVSLLFFLGLQNFQKASNSFEDASELALADPESPTSISDRSSSSVFRSPKVRKFSWEASEQDQENESPLPTGFDSIAAAPRRPKTWEPELQKIIDEGKKKAAEDSRRNLDDHILPGWITSKAWIRAFPPYSRYAELVAKAAALPDLIFIPFENAVSDQKLFGWEEEWITSISYDTGRWGKFEEPKIDFVYTWVNGSEEAFITTKTPYEWNSSLNDPQGVWVSRHGSNRYRDWDEFRYSLRSVEKHASFRNKILVLVNAVMDNETGIPSKQSPIWLADDDRTMSIVNILSQEEFFEEDKIGCVPSFNSLTIENQLHNTVSDVDQLFALSDDMLLGKPHAASDIYSPLFGPMWGFKTNSYNTNSKPTAADAQRFGEKPWLIYTSWLLNRRFGARKRAGMAHFGHSLSRAVMREAMNSFPGPELQSACSRFRGDFDFQLYSWYVAFHYTIERHREVLLWSYIMVRADPDRNGYLDLSERQKVMKDIEEGLINEGQSSFRSREFYHLPELLEEAGLATPQVNYQVLWTSMDGPLMTKTIDCFNFDINECLAPGFSFNDTTNFGPESQNPFFATSTIFDRIARQQPQCGDCLIKILLHRVSKGLSPLLPNKRKQSPEYETVLKAIMRYKYTVMDPDALFVMVTSAEQVESTLIKRFKTKSKIPSQLCLNDDVASTDESELEDLQNALNAMYEMLFPEPSSFEQV